MTLHFFTKIKDTLKYRPCQYICFDLSVHRRDKWLPEETGAPAAPLAAQAHPRMPARSRADGDTRAAPALGIKHLPGDTLRLGQDMGPRVGPAWWGSWTMRTGLWGPGEGPCCGIAGAGGDSPGRLRWVLGRGQARRAPGVWVGTVRAVSALRAMTVVTGIACHS